jgi:glycosyltransferase involved in cell wall biosynthesis
MTDSRIRAFIIGRFPPPVDGQTLATERLRRHLERAFDVTPITTSFPEEDGLHGEVRFRLDRVRFYAGLVGSTRRALSSDPTAPVLWGSVSPHPLGHLRDILLTLPAIPRSHPLIAIHHRAGFEKLFESPVTRPTAQRLARRVSAMVFLNRTFSEASAPWVPADRRFVIPNTIDDDLVFSDVEVEEKTSERIKSAGPLRILFLSNMMPEKGYRDVLEAAAIVRSEQLDVRFDFYGRWSSDEDRDVFDGFVEQHGLGRHVFHHGPLTSRRDVRVAHRNADVFVLPSYHPTETQPIAIHEACSAGTPVIGTNHAGIPDMVGGASGGFLVPVRDPQAIASAIRQLIDRDVWLAHARHTRAHFLANFSPEVVRQKWVELVRMLGT